MIMFQFQNNPGVRKNQEFKVNFIGSLLQRISEAHCWSMEYSKLKWILFNFIQRYHNIIYADSFYSEQYSRKEFVKRCFSEDLID